MPTATPPTGGGGGTSASCTIGPGSSDSDCSKSSAKLWSRIETAMDLTILQKPSVVDKTDSAIPGTELYKVVDVNGFIDGTIDNLRKAGLCAQRDPADYLYQRIQVKAENDYSETYDIVSSSGYIRRGNGTYFETCTPSSFPVDLGSEVPPAGSGCGVPYPPPVNRFRVHVYVQNTDTTTLDSTPLVVDPIYCAQIGYTGRVECPIRLEGSPERVPCETWAVGYAQDTGRAGPTWTHHTDENPDGDPLHRQGQRLREPPEQPVPGQRVRARLVQGLRAQRCLRLVLRRALTRPLRPRGLDPRRDGGLSFGSSFGRLTQR